MINVHKIETKEDLQKAFDIREQVFVIEQKVAREEEYDEFEDESIHFLAIENNIPVGTSRWRVTNGKAKLERFAVLEETRGKGAGYELVKATLEDIKNSDFKGQLYLHAQLPAMKLYSKFGFEQEGDLFVECDIEHYTMVKN